MPQEGNEVNRLPVLTASRMRDARACQRLHKLRYLDGWMPAEEAETLRLGRLVHLGLEAWWLALPGERLDAALAAVDAGETDPLDRVRAETMLLGYDARWAGHDLEVLAVEQPFRTTLVNPESGAASRTWELAGVLDAIVRSEGRTLIVEHKTAGEDVSSGSDYWKRLRMDGQVSVYYMGAKSLGYDVQGCLYDVLRKPALRPLKATPEEIRKYTKDGRLYANQREADETVEEFRARLLEAVCAAPDAFYSRGEVVRLEAEMTEAQYDIWQLGRQLREAEIAGRFPRNPDACVRFGRTCAFFGVCTGEASLDDPALFRRAENVHPELPNTI